MHVGFEHVRDGEPAIADHFDGVGEILFVPFALKHHDEYTRLVADRLSAIGLRVRGLGIPFLPGGYR